MERPGRQIHTARSGVKLGHRELSINCNWDSFNDSPRIVTFFKFQFLVFDTQSSAQKNKLPKSRIPTEKNPTRHVMESVWRRSKKRLHRSKQKQQHGSVLYLWEIIDSPVFDALHWPTSLALLPRSDHQPSHILQSKLVK